MEFLQEIAKNALAQYDYSRSLEESLEVLKTEMQELGSRETDLVIALNTAEQAHGKKPKAEVSLWLENVEKIRNQMTKIEEDYVEAGTDFSLARVALGKHVIKKIEEVVKLKERGRFPEGLLADLLPESGSMPIKKLVGRTSERNLEEIWDSLTDHEVRSIGVYGMGGVGKTTIMTHIYNKIQSSRIFGTVFWVTVSNDSSIERLQNGVARAIGLDLSYEEDEMRRSTKLFQALKHRGKCVIIFDDVWNPFALEKVGISEDNACKIVLTTRSKNVCRGMECQKSFEVKFLSREEAWELFKERLGTDVVLSSEVESIAKLVTEECGGLPLGIITVARAMREKDDISEWRNALEELKCSTMEIEGMDDQVFRILKFSYDRLKSERVQSCFLYCVLFPEDYAFSPEDLVKYWLAEGLIDDVGDWEKKLDKGQTILNGLIDVCMLIRRFDDHVVMHDLIRDLAIGIIRKSPQFVVNAGMRIRGPIGVEEFNEEAEKISLMRKGIEKLSGQPNCQKLTTLLLQENPILRKISDGFFNRMNILRVLNLSYTGIEYMPESVSNLENLRALLLKSCKRLREVPSLAKLKRLRILDLSDTCIKELPHGMECLVDLKELYVVSEEWVDLDLDRYVKSGHWKCLKRLCLESRSGNFTIKTDSVSVVNCNPIGEENSFVLPDSIVKLHMEGRELSILPCLSRLQCLQECKMSSFSMKWLLSKGDNSTIMSLPSLQSLFLKMLPSFRGLCEGVLMPGSFACLRRLTVEGCKVLENLMSLESFQHLQCLELINIRGCNDMEEVIKGGGEAMVEEGDNSHINNTVLLPKLKRLDLINLGKLKSVCKWVIICPSLISIYIVDCPRLKKIPLSLGHSTSVVRGEIKGSKEWWDALEWDDPNTKTLLPSFHEGRRMIKEVRRMKIRLRQVASASRQREEDGGGQEGRGIKRKAEQELQEVSSTSWQ